MDNWTCDYRKPECSNLGMELNGRWVCIKHLPEVKTKDEKIESLLAALTAMQSRAEKAEGEVERLKQEIAEREETQNTLIKVGAELGQERDALKARLQAMQQPVTDEEWEKAVISWATSVGTSSQHHGINRSPQECLQGIKWRIATRQRITPELRVTLEEAETIARRWDTNEDNEDSGPESLMAAINFVLASRQPPPKENAKENTDAS